MRRPDFPRFVTVSFYSDHVVCTIIEQRDNEYTLSALQIIPLEQSEMCAGIIFNLTAIAHRIQQFITNNTVSRSYLLMVIDDSVAQHSIITTPLEQELDISILSKPNYRTLYQRLFQTDSCLTYYVCSIKLPALFTYLHCAVKFVLPCIAITTHFSALFHGYSLLCSANELLDSKLSYIDVYTTLQKTIGQLSVPCDNPLTYVENIGLFNQGKLIYELSH